MSDIHDLQSEITNRLEVLNIPVTDKRYHGIIDALINYDTFIDKVRHMTKDELVEFGEGCTCQLSRDFRHVYYDDNGCPICGIKPLKER